MPGASRKTDPLLYPPLTPALKARMRTAGHVDMVDLLDRVSASTIRGLMKAAASGPVFKPKVAGNALGARKVNRGRSAVHRPHPQKEAKPYVVRNTAKFLMLAGIKP